MNAYLVSVLESYKVSAIDTLRKVDQKAVVHSGLGHGHPCLFSVVTKLSTLSLESIDGVAHVIFIAEVVG